MKIYFSLLILFVFFSHIYSQVVTVTDLENGQPLEYVMLKSDKPRAHEFTNADGQAELIKFKKSKIISFQLLGYKKINISYSNLKKAAFKLTMEQTNISLDQIIISATRWNQSSKENPMKIATIIPKDAALQNPQTAADLLAASGEVFIQKSQQGSGSPMIRGFATNRLLITVDGIRMNTAIFRSGNLQNVISLDPFSMERTEVLFGPGSIIYGSDAIGGVMSFYTFNPQFSLDNNPFIKGDAVVRRATANNEFTGHVDVNIGWRNFALATSITFSDYGNLKMGSIGPDDYLRKEYVKTFDHSDHIIANDNYNLQTPTGYNQINLMQKFHFKPSQNWDFVYGFHYSTTSNYDRYDRLIRYKNGLPRSAEWYYGPQKWMMNNLNITNYFINDFYDEISIRIAQQYFEESRHDRDFNGIIKANRIEEVDAYSINIDFTKAFGNIYNLNYGIEAVYDEVVSTGTDENISTGIITKGPARYPKSNWTSMAAYATYQMKFTRQFMLEAGLRYNQFILNADFDNTFYPFPFSEAKINNGALTGSLGFVYNPDDSWSIGTNFSTGFRSPNVDDIGKVFDSEPGSVVVPNPDLKAEYAYNFEVGAAKVFDDFLKIDLTAYYTILENAMVRRDFTLNGADSIFYDGELSQVQAIQNAAKAYVWGLQSGVEIKLPGGFGLSSRFNYQKGEEELEDGSKSPLRHAGPWFGITHLTYSARKLKVDLYSVYNGEISGANLALEEQGKDYLYASDENGKPYSPGWYTLNFKLMYQLLESVSISAGIENFTDQRYRPYSSGLSAPGRNFIIAMKTGL